MRRFVSAEIWPVPKPEMVNAASDPGSASEFHFFRRRDSLWVELFKLLRIALIPLDP
jgi:hypothetical protein